MKPAVSFDDRFTLWVVSHEANASTWSVWRGPRTFDALDQALQRARKGGARAHIELESVACSPVPLSLAELLALGVIKLHDETPPPRKGARGLLAVVVAILLGGIAGCGSEPPSMQPPTLRPCSDFGFEPASFVACGTRDGRTSGSCEEMPRNIPDCLVDAGLCVAACGTTGSGGSSATDAGVRS